MRNNYLLSLSKKEYNSGSTKVDKNHHILYNTRTKFLITGTKEQQMSAHNNDKGQEEQVTRTFNPNDHLVQIKNRNGSADYLPVQWRLVWFREHCPEGSIETEMLHLDLDRETEEEGYAWNNDTRRSEKVIKRAIGLAVFRATVRDGKGGIATGTKSEKAASFPDYIEKAETGAIGRALAALGYGTQFAPDLDEQHRIVDAPVDRNTPANDGNGNERNTITSMRTSTIESNGKAKGTTGENLAGTHATDQQLASIRKLCQHLGKPEPEQPETMSYQDAKALITQLSHEYNEQKQHRKAS
jgi:hypothetical protein